MNSDYEKGKSDEREKIMKYLYERSKYCFEQAGSPLVGYEKELMWITKGDEVGRMLNEIRNGKHDN